MAKRLHKFCALLFAFIVLSTTTSFSLDMHFCGGHLVDFSVIGEVEQCDMDAAIKAWTGCDSSKSFCCSDETVVIEGQDQLTQSVNDVDFANVWLFTPSSKQFSLPFLIGYELCQSYSFIEPDPPVLNQQLLPLYQQYLI